MHAYAANAAPSFRQPSTSAVNTSDHDPLVVSSSDLHHTTLILNSMNICSEKNDGIPEFLQVDLEHAYTLEVEDFFRTVLDVSHAWVDAHHGTLRDVVGSNEYAHAARVFGRVAQLRGTKAFHTLVDEAAGLLAKDGLLEHVPVVFSSDRVSRRPCKPAKSTGLLVLEGTRKCSPNSLACSSSISANGQASESLLRLTNLAHKDMSYGSWSDHVLGVVVTEQTIQLAYFDHSAIVLSSPFNVIRQPILFLTMLCGLGALQSAEPKDVGVCVERCDSDTRIRLSNGAVLQLEEILHQQHGLMGRATCVVRVSQVGCAEDSDWSGKKLIMKISWPPEERTSEVDVLELAHAQAVETGQTWVLDHLPSVLHCEQHHDASVSNGDLRSRLVEHFGRAYEGRVLRMVLEEELQPMTRLQCPIDLGIVINDVFRCYRWLYEECGVSHRDISYSNIMFHTRGGSVKGVLNDFDLASIGSVHDQLTPSQGTGTRLFMAIELLGQSTPPHYYRHDLESLMYVMLWHASRNNNGAFAEPSPYERWGDASIDSDILEAYKIRFVHEEELQLTSHSEVLREWIQRIQVLFRNGFRACRKAKEEREAAFDYETLGGTVTFDTFAKVCSESLKELVARGAGRGALNARL